MSEHSHRIQSLFERISYKGYITIDNTNKPRFGAILQEDTYRGEPI
jgi:hypothetical protein